MSKNVTDIFTAIEVAQLFMETYKKACLADYEKNGDVEKKEQFITNYERVDVMFNSLKMTKIMKLPERWLSENIASTEFRKFLDDEYDTNLLANVAIAQEEAQELVKQLDLVVFSNNGVGTCQRRYLDLAFTIKSGADIFISDSSSLIQAMNDEKERKEIIDELKMYL